MTTTATAAPAHVEGVFLRRPGNIERAAVVLIFFIYSFSLPNEWFIADRNEEISGGPITQLTFLAFLGIAILGLNGNWRIAGAAAAREPLIPALLGIAVLSTLWSSIPGTTLSNSAVLCFTYIIAIYLLVRFSLSEVLYLAGIAFALGIVLNYFFIFALPDTGVSITPGDTFAKWTGVFRSKNTLGRIAVLSALVFAMNSRLRRGFFVWPSLVLLAAVQVIGSGSATSLAGLGATAAFWVGFLGFRARKTLYGATVVMMVTAFSIITVTAATNLGGATALVGRDTSFTGRLPLWQDSIEFGIMERLWLGHGWGAFWTAGGPDFEVLLRANFIAPHAHNAFIDAWLQGGPLAAIALTLIYVRGLFWSARNIRADKTAAGLFPALVISLGVIFSLTESGYINRTSMFILLIVGVTHAAGNKGVVQPFKKPESPELPVARRYSEPLALGGGFDSPT